ncbi:MAG: hypothetical protein NVS2B12_05540 [Ktedonobacteraceae bacterium]
MTATFHSTSGRLTLAAVARRFYQQFKVEYTQFSEQIQGIIHPVDRLAYASLMFNRLFTLYFLQKKCILAGNSDYLAQRLQQVQQHVGVDCFYGQCFLPLIDQLYGISAPESLLTGLLGDVPALPFPIFERHELESTQGHLLIPDIAFTRIFAFFDLYSWQSDVNAPQGENELRPDILAYVFEHSVDQKHSGAYYTQEDITTYIASNTIIPCLFTDLTQSYQDEADLNIWQLLQADPDRYIHHALRSKDYLLEETELEYQQRQMRYTYIYTRLHTGQIQNIDDFITYNLDLTQFADDIIRSDNNSGLLLTIYARLENMLILDPTCGTGAFLFAALATLTPLFMACIEHMLYTTARTYNTASGGTHAARVQEMHTILARVRQHPDPSHFVIFTILTQNLYGVDLMREAVDICQVRLSLALLACASHGSGDAEGTAPPIHLNIRYGNTLVGDIHPQGSSLSSARAGRTQTPSVAKKAGRDSKDGHTKDGHTSDRPFHWREEFPILKQRAGFDVIIGNPPYLEYSRVRHDYVAYGYEKKSCGNLYAAVIERSLALCSTGQSYLGLIVPISICGGERFAFLRRALSQSAAALWLANFEIFPCRLFENAFQRLSIVLAKHQPGPTARLHVTGIHRWFAQERSHLIQRLTYTQVEYNAGSRVFPKFASPRQEHILQKMHNKAAQVQIATILHDQKTSNFVYYQEATNYWTKAVCRVPHYKKNGEIMTPAHGRFLFFEQEHTARIIMALMNSSLFYIWFTSYSDGFHLSHTLVKTFPLSSALLMSQELYDLALLLEEDIQAHTRLSTHNTKDDLSTQRPGHLIELEEYQMRYSKNILDKVDTILADYYSFTHEELHFIINYDIKYRMSKHRKK